MNVNEVGVVENDQVAQYKSEMVKSLSHYHKIIIKFDVTEYSESSEPKNP